MNEREIFIQAVQVADVDAQVSFVNQACGSDQALRHQVSELLAAHARAQSFLEAPPPGIEARDMPTLTEAPGTQIGPYKLLEQIGEGGMGTVYVAEQKHPVRRKVALKIIKPGMDTKEVVARFEAERQALALMDHPNIAKVFDAGTTGGDRESHPKLEARTIPTSDEPISRIVLWTLRFFRMGRPYFVMELVRGIPITEYADEAETPDPRTVGTLHLRLPSRPARASMKGIIHRDIKPSNVMVTEIDGAAVPKVIDFGVAKATNQRLTERRSTPTSAR